MAEAIETVSIADEVRGRFLRYAMSVVTGRALPDVRDGLKPVQRRILYGMYQDLNLTFDRKAAKSAQIVGKVMGDYHPHGDMALYDAMVRLAQDWVMRVPLVYGEGNFGSVDGDPPAAHRYTEAKLSRPAGFLLAELDQETVEMRENYTGTKKEPSVLPAQFPNLLVNGSSGIAVGMATNIPPHNLGEVLRACILLIENPDATLAQLLEKIKGPDFPLGGKIVTDRPTLKKIYEEGTGTIRVQGEWKLEEKGRERQIVVTSIPYGVNKGLLENAIGGLIETKKLPQLLAVTNETNDKDGLRITLDLKPGADPQLVMAYLYKHTELQKPFSYNMTALVPTGEESNVMVPKDGLSLKEMLRHFLDFRLLTVRKRFEYELRVLKRRIHILDGFRIIFNGLDLAIKLIRESTGKPDAAEKLIAEFKLDEEQTNAILDSQLYKIARLEIRKILDELKEKRDRAEQIEALLASKKRLWTVVRKELESLEEQFPERRKTRMASDEDVLEFDENAYIVKENTNVVLTRDGWVKRVGRLAAVESTRVREGDEVTAVVPASTLDTVVFFADDGTAYTIKASDIPASSGYGEPITKFFKLADGVKILAAVTTDGRFVPADTENADGTPAGPFVLVATSGGFVLRTPLASYRGESTKAGRRFVKLGDGEKVVLARLVNGEKSVVLVSDATCVIRFDLDQVNVLGGVGRGVIGIKLAPDARCLGGELIGGRADKIRVEKDNGKEEELEIPKPIERGGTGREVNKRIRFVRVVPPAIELVNWDEVEGKVPKDKGNLFE